MSEQQPAPPRSVEAVLRGEVADMPVRQIIATVADAFGYSAADLVGPDTRREIVRARYAAIHAVRQAKKHFSLPQLGSAFGRDHTTILYALRKMDRSGVPQPPAALRGAPLKDTAA